jgi:hypothetical protein
LKLVLIQRAVSSLLRPSDSAVTATLFLDVAIHALIHSLLVRIEREIATQGAASISDLVDEECDETWCESRLFTLALYELCPARPLTTSRDATDMAAWCQLVVEITESLLVLPPVLLHVLGCDLEADDALPRLAQGVCSYGSSHPARDEVWVAAYLADAESVGPRLRPRLSCGPSDLRFANVCLAALAFDETSEASFFNECFEGQATAERIRRVAEAVALLTEAERSAQDAHLQVGCAMRTDVSRSR